nr:hypothetical protein CFP56_76677 [Quercus suber]
MYNHLLHTLDVVKELSQVALENAWAASEASTQATGRGGQGGGSRGRGGAGDDKALEGDWDMYMDGTRSLRCMPDAAAGPSHPVGHNNSAEHTSHAQAGPRSPPPTLLFPPLLSGSTHEGGCIFIPTPGRPTPLVVQVEPTQEPSLPNPDEPAAQIDQKRSENIELVHGLRRSLRTNIHPPGYGTGDSKYHAFPMNFFQIYLIKQ